MALTAARANRESKKRNDMRLILWERYGLKEIVVYSTLEGIMEWS